jgi:uncharacterized protein
MRVFLRTVAFGIATAVLSGSAFANCSGQDLIAAMSADARAALDQRVAQQPFAQGNFWRATRGDEVLTIAGTYHMDDPRLDAILSALTPMIETAKTVLVEAGPDEQAALKAAVARDPGVMFITDGATLPERLPEAEWARLADALRARGIPPFVGAKFQPWYISIVLSMPPCAMADLQAGARGLDQRVTETATTVGVPLRALEPYDTLFQVFGAIPDADQEAMIRSSLALADQAEDYHATLIETYFAQDSRMIWEFARLRALQDGTEPKAMVEAEFALMNDILLVRRNRSWIPVIEAALTAGPAFAAFGALHLSGEDGVLALLERAGFTLERLPI